MTQLRMIRLTLTVSFKLFETAYNSSNHNNVKEAYLKIHYLKRY
jgi:hypothetical protein